ncbi:hypothetical protein B0J14DRAFT_656155 [Halenospora varia]|nr:hypothetical protein B0J14DRAFT_656155 [Halenospora varia]
MLTGHAANITVTPSISPQGPSIYAQDSPNITFYHADRDPNADLDQDAIQVLPQPSDPPTRRDWEAYRTIFTHLYRTENRSLKEVMSIMADQYKFKATPRMFKRRVTDWKLNKNYKAAEREAIARVVERYRNHGDPTPTILVRGQPVKMHRIQRHCKIGQSLTSPFGSAGSFDSSVLNNDARQIHSGGLTMEYDKEMNLMDDMRTQKGNLPKMAGLFKIPLRQLSPPDELKHAEIVIYQTNVFYESYAQSMVTGEIKGNGALGSEAGVDLSAFVCKVSTALQLRQRRAGWRLLNEAMDMIKPILESKHPHTLRVLVVRASDWEYLSLDIYRVIWRQISKMASIVLGDSDPLSKVCLAITHIKSNGHVNEAVNRLLSSMFERTLGPYHVETLQAKSDYTTSLVGNGDFARAECLQRMVISDFEKLGHKYGEEVVFEAYVLGYILNEKGDFSGAKKVFRDALQLSRVASEEKSPTVADLYIIEEVVSRLAEDEYIEGQVLLQEALRKGLEYGHWGRNDWQTVSVLVSLENLLEKQEKFDEAEMLRLQYPEAF